MPDTVHVLTFGVSLCQTPPGLPHQWPKGHRWVRAEKFAEVPLSEKCPRCKTKMAVDSDRLIKSAASGKEALRRRNPCAVAECVLMQNHFGDHERKDGSRFAGRR